MTDHVFEPGQRVEWTEKLSEVSSVHRVGTVVPRDSDVLTDGQRGAIDYGTVLAVQEPLGKIYMVERYVLAPHGWAEQQRRLKIINGTHARVQALIEDAADISGSASHTANLFSDREDTSDLVVTFEEALTGLRHVERILRLNGTG